MRLRQISEPPDREILSGFDASFSTERIYHLSLDGLNVEISDIELSAALKKTFTTEDIEASIAGADRTIFAEIDGRIAGFAALKYEIWNQRASLLGIYVAPADKGSGIGTALIREAIGYAETAGARCLWIETQNINYPAISFYLQLGFHFCGFDTSLYDPAMTLSDEIAFYFRFDLRN